MSTAFAQAVVEYGLMQQMAAGAQKASYAVRGFISDAGPGTWLLLGVVVASGIWYLTSRSSRA